MELDYDPIYEIAVRYNYKDLLNFCKTSRGTFKGICGRNAFWKRKTYYDFGDLYDNIEKFGRNWWDTYQHYRSVFSKDFIRALRANSPDANLIYDTIGVINERGFLIVDETDERGNTALMAAADKGYGDIVRFLLEEEGANPNLTNANGNTALIKASREGHTDIVEMLLNAGSDPNLADRYEDTALTLASQFGHTAIVEMLLLDSRTDPNLRDGNGWTALMEASDEGHTAIVEMLLLDSRTDPNLTDDNLADEGGWTALMLASYQGHTDIVEMLLNAKADPNLVTRDGWTALRFASQEDRPDIVDMLEPVTES